MIIVADENMPLAADAFSTLGETRLEPGRAMTADVVRDAAVLAVRSVTKVNAELLEGSSVRFVGTATIGMDHIDRAYLSERGIGFASAPGSNANSVAEYIVAALLTLSERRGEALRGRAIGVVGCGNVGSRVAAKAEALGMRVLRNDPPLRRSAGDDIYRPLDEMFDADFISLHVPLTRHGPDPTFHMADAEFLSRMRPDATLINSSRGAVAHTAALLAALREKRIRDAVLDVWEGEPDIDFALLERAALATPHIAGYSYDGKLNGVDMIYRATCGFLGVEPSFDIKKAAPEPGIPTFHVNALGRPDQRILRETVREIYDIEADDARLRAAADLPAPERGARFDELRKTYPVRREFTNTRLVLSQPRQELADAFAGVGFQV